VPTRTLDKALTDLAELYNRNVTGHDGIDWLTDILETLPADDAKVIERIIAKDLKCGASGSTVNKVWPNFIYEYPCMLCSGYEEKLINKIKFPATVQLKMDGMRFNAIVKDNNVEFRSRNGKEIQLLGYLVDDFIRLAAGKDCVYDGELLVVDDGVIMDRQTGNGILNKAVKGTISASEASKVNATVWDVIPYEDFKNSVCRIPYKDRFESLQNIDNINIRLVENTTVASLDEARELFESYLDKGQEGIILKDSTGIWENKRVKHQIKFKGELECDLRIVGWEEGTGKYTGRLGSLVGESSDGQVRTNVGTGYSDALRDQIGKEVIGKIMAVKYNARIKDKNSDTDALFLPVFLEIREDKTEADSGPNIK
jgi:ATP-dependent DNA ligase